MLLQILVISVSLSIDALGIGIAYKLRGVKIGAGAKTVIGLMSCFIMYLSIIAGKQMSRVIPSDVLAIVGTAILVLMGVIYIRNSLFSDEEAAYDLDQSKKIDFFEAVILGAALSADSISAGIAIVAVGLKGRWIPIIVGVMQVVFLSMGSFLLSKFLISKEINSKVCGVVSGLLLIIIAIARCF